MKSERYSKSDRFDKLHELLKNNEAYESSCARKARLFDEIMDALSESVEDCDKLKRIQFIAKKIAGGKCGG